MAERRKNIFPWNHIHPEYILGVMGSGESVHCFFAAPMVEPAQSIPCNVLSKHVSRGSILPAEWR